MRPADPGDRQATPPGPPAAGLHLTGPASKDRAVGELHADRTRLEAFRRGDEAVLREVYLATVADVYRVLRLGFRWSDKLIPGLADAAAQEDLAQEVYARAFAPTARAAYSGTVPYRAYLLQIVRNLMVDHARRGRREHVPNDPQAEAFETLLTRAQADEPQPEPEPTLDERRQQEAVTAFAQALEEGDRALYGAVYRSGLSEREAAAQLGISRRKVRAGADRLRLRLRNHLKEKGLWP